MTWRKALYGLVAGVFTVVIYSIDRLGVSAFYKGILSYSLSLPLLLVIGVMGFIWGMKKEYTMSLVFMASMVAYDLLTNDMKTVLFAGISGLTLLLGAVASTVASRLETS